MTTQLRQRLGELAGDAPSPAGGADDLWQRGKRYGRRRAMRGTALALTALLLFSGAATAGWLGLDHPEAAGPATPGAEVRLPDRLFTPSPWLPSTTAEDGPPGQLVALVGGEHKTLFSTTRGVFGVSASTGRYRFLDLPDYSAESTPSLSPDGTRVAYWLSSGAGVLSTVQGFAVYDAVSGQLARHRVESKLGLEPDAIGWAGGRVWFQYSTVTQADGDSMSSTAGPVTVWDVARDEVATAPSAAGSVMFRATSTARGIVASGVRDGYAWVDGDSLSDWPRFTTSLALAGAPILSPDGLRVGGLFAGANPSDCCSPQPLVVGRFSTDGGRLAVRKVPVFRAGAVLGWRDDTHLLAQRIDRAEIYVVDIETGAAERLLSLPAQSSAPGTLLATDLLGADLVPGQQPASPPDQRLLLAGGVSGSVLGAVLLGVLLVGRRRVRP